MLYYSLQIVAFQLMFLLIYDIFLKRETFFNYNRIYLLVTAVLSFVLPFIKLDILQTVAPKDFVVVLPEVIIGNSNTPSQLNKEVALQVGIELNEPSMPIWQMVFYTGMVLAALLFLYKLLKLFWLKSKNPKRWQGNILIVRLIKSASAFSFFNTIFIGENISMEDKPTILEHELVHVKQWHSLDVMLFEIMRILVWFNPLIYMYQNRIKALHEYIADETAVRQKGKKTYYNQLLNQVFETQDISFTNTFFNKSLIKKRIVMLQKTKSKQLALMKYALLIPVVFGMLIYSSTDVRAQDKKQKTEEINIKVETQDLSERILIEEYYKKMKGLQQSNNFKEIMEMAYVNTNNFTMSLDEYAKLRAFSRLMITDRIREKVKLGKAEKSEIELMDKVESKNETYSEYLKSTKTEKYQKDWESRAKDGTQRLFVKELTNLNNEEKKRYEKKVALIEKDKFWHTLYMTDGESSKSIEFEKHKSSGKNDEEISIVDMKNSIEVPFSVIDNIPTFNICDNVKDEAEKKQCTSNEIAKFVNKNFNTDLATQLGLEGRLRISVFFKIDKEGNVTSIGARAPHPGLEKEAKRVIAMLPKFIPGTHKGKAVTVPYSLPILFEVKGDDNTEGSTPEDVPNIQNPNSEDYNSLGKGIPFSEVDVIPTYKECKTLNSKEERKKCTSDKVAKYVNRNFNVSPLVTEIGLTGRHNIAVSFKIDKEGNVINVVAKGSHPKIENHAEYVVGNLPKFIPGEHQGKKVDVSFSLPILFQVHTPKKDKK